MNVFTFSYKVVTVLGKWLRTKGVRNTLICFYGRSVPMLTGQPLEKYSRITPEIYVGAQHNRAGKRRLEQLQINCIVNMRSEFDDAANDLTLKHYYYLPTIDETAPTIEQLLAGVAFIHQAVAEGGKVYIHCRSGIGRAPTMAAAYLISQGLSLEQAVEQIQRVRPFVEIKPVQMEQLQWFETIMRQSVEFNSSG